MLVCEGEAVEKGGQGVVRARERGLTGRSSCVNDQLQGVVAEHARRARDRLAMKWSGREGGSDRGRGREGGDAVECEGGTTRAHASSRPHLEEPRAAWPVIEQKVVQHQISRS